MKIAPSILSADFWKLNEEIKEIEQYSHWIHVDVMDGHFVPNITIWAPVVKCIKSIKPLDCHLMIKEPEKYIWDFIKAWAFSVSTHIELWVDSVRECLRQCRESWVKYWVVINPPTDVEKIFPVLDEVDFVLVMSVNPGFWGQKFMLEVLNKVKEIKKRKPKMLVEIDWWINWETIKIAKDAWVDIAVAWSFIFWAEDKIRVIKEISS